MSEVLVVGAGPSGLTLACLLRGQGVQVRVVDRLARPSRLAKAMVLWSRTLEILDVIGIADAAVAAGVDLARAVYLDGGRTLASVRTNRVPGTSRQPLILPQHVLEELLRQRLHALGCSVEWSTAVTAIDAGDERVDVELIGASGSMEHCSLAYVAGCDGLRSMVRAAAGIGWCVRAPYEQVFQLGDVEVDTSLDCTTVYQFLGRSGVSVAIPMPGGLMRIAGYFDGETPDRPPDRAGLQRLLDDVGHDGTRIGDVRWSGTFRVVRRLADSFRAGRLLLVGDAAHVHSPAGGQGLNTGIQDANNLAWKLALVVRGHAGATLLDSYTTERRPIAARILAMTEMQDKRLFGARSLAARSARRVALRVGDRTGLLERVLIPDLAQVRLRYKDSPLTIGGGRGARALAPGRQAPDVEYVAADGTGSVSLRDTDPGAALTLVAVDGGRSSRLTDVQALVGEHSTALRLRHASAWVADGTVGGPGSVIGVRPDGYIGYRGPCADTPALRAWIEAVLVKPLVAGSASA